MLLNEISYQFNKYDLGKNEPAYTTEGPERSTGTETVSVPAEYSGEDLEAFLGFISEDRQSVSNSVYLGSVTVA